MREPRDSDRDVTDVARSALFAITEPETVGPVVGVEDETDGLVDVYFASTLPGYPGWRWTVSLSVLDAEDPQVLETELTPGEGALLAPDWVPWADRLAEYRAAGHELPELGEDDEHDDDDDSDDDEESDDVDGVDFDGALDEGDDDHDDDVLDSDDADSDDAHSGDEGSDDESELEAAHRAAAARRRERDDRGHGVVRGGGEDSAAAAAVDFDHHIVDVHEEADPDAIDPNERTDDDHGFGYVAR